MRSIEASRPNLTTEEALPKTPVAPFYHSRAEIQREHEVRIKHPDYNPVTHIRMIPRAELPQRKDLLDANSRLLTKKGPFTTADVFAFADNMQRAAESIILDESISLTKGVRLNHQESLTVVPDIIPETGRARISLQQRVDGTGASINIVTHGVGDKPDTRYVIGENFAQGVNHTTNPMTSEGRYKTHHTSTKASTEGVVLDPETTGRALCEDIFVAHLANAGRISPDQADQVITQLHEGTPVTQLEPAK
jgi:hypothetical protein